MRAIHAPSRSVMLLNEGFGYSFFQPSGSNVETSKYPNFARPGARSARSHDLVGIPSVTKSLHGGQKVLHAEKVGVQIRGHRLSPRRKVELVNGPIGKESGIVDDDLDVA